MYNSNLENKLISPDIRDLMSDYVSMQLDIDDTKIKAAALVAQELDIARVVQRVNLDRVIGLDEETADPQDWELRELIIAPWCYYTYARCLLMFQGTFTDSGFAVESEAEARNAAKSVSNEMKSIGDTFLQKVIDFLQEEAPSSDVSNDKLSTRVRVFGGQENRASN